MSVIRRRSECQITPTKLGHAPAAAWNIIRNCRLRRRYRNPQRHRLPCRSCRSSTSRIACRSRPRNSSSRWMICNTWSRYPCTTAAPLRWRAQHHRRTCRRSRSDRTARPRTYTMWTICSTQRVHRRPPRCTCSGRAAGPIQQRSRHNYTPRPEPLCRLRNRAPCTAIGWIGRPRSRRCMQRLWTERRQVTTRNAFATPVVRPLAADK